MNEHLEVRGIWTAQGSRVQPSIHQRATGKHINEPSKIAERHAANMNVDATTMNLNDSEGEDLSQMVRTRHALVESGRRNPGEGWSGPKPFK